ncbi:MAG: hypothetical protein M1822_007925 [Bathelium mastoideum]|nr:MAG: hypothetical protein M1822_007925 [Bathelium mastoideum]
MVKDTSYAIAALPKISPEKTDPNTIITRVRDFRLKSLQLAPESFGSTYEVEAKKQPEFWVNRVANPKATTFIAYETERTNCSDLNDDHAQGFLNADWLGSITLLGPKQGLAEFSLHTSPWVILRQDCEQFQDVSGQAEPLRHYLINGMFVTPAARGLGLGRALVDAAMDHAMRQTRENDAEIMKCTLIVDNDNDAARTLYLRSGFAIVKEEMFKPEIGKHRPALTMELTRTVSRA